MAGTRVSKKVAKKPWDMEKVTTALGEDAPVYLGLNWEEKERDGIAEKKDLLAVTRNCRHCSG